MQIDNDFDSNGYVIIRNLIDLHSIDIISQYMENKIRRKEWLYFKDETDNASGYAYYADPLIEVMLLKCKDAVEESTGREVYPTYSYMRTYVPGEQLYKHVDRPSCEISVTVNVFSSENNSPIYSKYNGVESKHYLNPGDAMIYKGCAVEHWRDRLTEDQLVVQFMLHYVDKNGPRSSFKYDRREMIGQNKV